MPILNPSIETMGRKELLELQLERLQIVVNQAYSNVDFYRKRFDEAERIGPSFKPYEGVL